MKKQNTSTDPTAWQAADPLADVLSAAEQAGLSARPVDIPPSMERRIAFGITAYGSPDVVQQYDEDVRPYEPVFTDKGTNVGMAAEDWLKIPLAGDWTSTDAKLAHCVYPMGLKEQQPIDETFDKMHKDNKMEWSTESTPFGFPVFVAWRTVYVDSKPVVTSLSSSNSFWQRDHTSRKPMGNAGHTSPRRSRGQHFLFMTRRVKLFLSSLSFFLLFSFTILSLATKLITFHSLLAYVCSICARP